MSEDSDALTLLQPVGLTVASATPETLPVLDEARYEDLGPLGAGGMASVRAQRDRLLRRRVARKTLHPDLARRADLLSRFAQEAQLLAQLTHPGIVPVHDLGIGRDGQLSFFMREVQGRTLVEEAIAAHAEGMSAHSPALQRLLHTFRRACEAVAYAHARGVVHRDLKPDNILVGAYGEVLVVDWGLATVQGATPIDTARVQTGRTEASDQTQVGDVLGTPSYMPPEQARGETDRIGPEADVYALGATLYFLLTLRPPFKADSIAETLKQVQTAPLRPLPRWVPAPLRILCTEALAADPSDRPGNAGHLAAGLDRWLDGSARQARALETVAEAEPWLVEALASHRAAEEEADAGQRALAAVPVHAGEAARAPAHRHLDEAAAHRRKAVELEARAVRALHAALAMAPELPEAHQALARHHLQAHRRCLARGDAIGAIPHEGALADHVHHLRPGPERARLEAWLDGQGTLQLDTEPPTTVVARPLELRARRCQPGAPVALGTTPIDTPLPHGPWALELELPDGSTQTLPVVVPRAEAARVQAPDAPDTPLALPPPPPEGVRAVPPGWVTLGGDPLAPNPHPARTLWCDGLWVDTHPVTNRRFIAFLDALGAAGEAERARALVPLTPTPAYVHTARGWVPGVDEDGDAWRLDDPVLHIDLARALAFAAWRRDVTGIPWRLPTELEWMRFARGADRRLYPWGDHFEPSWAALRSGRRARRPAGIDEHPHDVSVFGVRHLAGNAAEWTSSRADAPLPQGRIPPGPVAPEGSPGQWVLRGGHWFAADQRARLASRFFVEPHQEYSTVGFRLVASMGRAGTSRVR